MSSFYQYKHHKSGQISHNELSSFLFLFLFPFSTSPIFMRPLKYKPTFIPQFTYTPGWARPGLDIIYIFRHNNSNNNPIPSLANDGNNYKLLRLFLALHRGEVRSFHFFLRQPERASVSTARPDPPRRLSTGPLIYGPLCERGPGDGALLVLPYWISGVPNSPMWVTR